MNELHLPWLELSVLVPVVGAIIVGRVRQVNVARLLTIAICLITLISTIGEWIDFANLNSFEAHDHWDLLEWLFDHEVFVIDELNAPLLPLAALLCLLTVLSTLRTKQTRFAFHWMLVSEAILLSTLSCRFAWGIVLLSTAAILPMWFEIHERGRSTQVFSFHMGLFVAALFVGQCLVDLGWVFFGGALLTFAGLLRTGIVPLHCWMTDLFEKCSFGNALLFVAPMPGAYLVMRLVLPIAPDWALRSIAVISLITAVYAGGMALVQTEGRRFFCYLFLSHSSLVLVGLELATPIGLTGGLCVWLSVGLALSGFGITLRCVEGRTGRVDLGKYHGLYDNMPTLAAFFLLTGLASIGFPGTVGFIGTELLIEGAVGVYPLVGMAVVVAAALNGIAILQAYFKIFTGVRHEATFCLRSRLPEKIAVLLLTTLIIGGGLFPEWGILSRYHAANELLRHRGSSLTASPTHHTSFPNQPKHGN
ncbi:proton-conducting transporter transmembrane domain-containing protein [Roseiconus lacunae]|uniref:proton-conducting transporter transmembrane domain-containing protein n=1 Tax=Roseiconus lacunae TaxID=2605694 RepID=UPI0011F20819|nr:proton-conducting transporter membrane subunit [Roseiconus lacunae]